MDDTLTILHDNALMHFQNDIKKGLLSRHKNIPSKYFYDHAGGELFNQITRHPDYYLTRCETEILKQNKESIIDYVLDDNCLNLIELGPGEGVKSEILITEIMRRTKDFFYIPVDVSPEYLTFLKLSLQKRLQDIKIQPVQDDIFNSNWLNKLNDNRNFILFLGSSIGNYTLENTNKFLSTIAGSLNPGDFFLIGFDMRKDIQILMKAYDDDAGITANFNLNLLHRVNKELNADFDVDGFKHYATYNVYTNAMESYLISLKKQSVNIDGLNQQVHFDVIEPIHVECSYKYCIEQIYYLAGECGFEVVANYTDDKGYFVDSLWRVVGH